MTPQTKPAKDETHRTRPGAGGERPLRSLLSSPLIASGPLIAITGITGAILILALLLRSLSPLTLASSALGKLKLQESALLRKGLLARVEALEEIRREAVAGDDWHLLALDLPHIAPEGVAGAVVRDDLGWGWGWVWGWGWGWGWGCYAMLCYVMLCYVMLCLAGAGAGGTR